MKKNLMKEKLQKGGIAAGVIIQDPAVQVVEVLGLLGFDWLFIDCEHSPMSLEEVGKLVNPKAGEEFKKLRFRVYTLEKTILISLF